MNAVIDEAKVFDTTATKFKAVPVPFPLFGPGAEKLHTVTPIATGFALVWRPHSREACLLTRERQFRRPLVKVPYHREWMLGLCLRPRV
jgi:hypothetical protein